MISWAELQNDHHLGGRHMQNNDIVQGNVVEISKFRKRRKVLIIGLFVIGSFWRLINNEYQRYELLSYQHPYSEQFESSLLGLSALAVALFVVAAILILFIIVLSTKIKTLEKVVRSAFRSEVVA